VGILKSDLKLKINTDKSRSLIQTADIDKTVRLAVAGLELNIHKRWEMIIASC
jgi:hypothetical protein